MSTETATRKRRRAIDAEIHRADAKQRTCADCGHLCDQPGEFHPHMFCVLKKAGSPNPWEDFAWAYERLTGNSLPARPPAVRDLPLKQGKAS